MILACIQTVLDAIVPVKNEIGVTLFAAHDVWIDPQQWENVLVGFKLVLPPGFLGRVVPRPDLMYNHGIICSSPTITQQQQDGVFVTMSNSGQNTFCLHRGDPIADLIFHSITLPEIVAVAV